MDVVVSNGFEVGVRKTGEAHEEKHVPHGTLTFCISDPRE